MTVSGSIQGDLRKTNEIPPAGKVNIINLPTWGPRSRSDCILVKWTKTPVVDSQRNERERPRLQLWIVEHVDRMITKRSVKMVDFEHNIGIDLANSGQSNLLRSPTIRDLALADRSLKVSCCYI